MTALAGGPSGFIPRTRLLAMSCRPTLQVQDGTDIPAGKIVCLARTYRRHAEEMGSPVSDEVVMFLKPASAIIHDGQSICIPEQAGEIHHEVEMAVVIGKQGSRIPAGCASAHVYGYAVAVDITARDLQRDAKQRGLPWTIAKGYDTFCPVSTVTPASKVLDPHHLELGLWVNSELRQQSTTVNLIYPISEIIAQVSDIMTLCRGDVILTGTPQGVGQLEPGDVVEARLDDRCCLTVQVQ